MSLFKLSVRPRLLFGTSVLIFLPNTGCGALFDNEQPGWMHARVEGTANGEYRGSGEFGVSWQPEIERGDFVVSSSSVDPDSPATFLLIGIGMERPAVGTYQVRLISHDRMAGWKDPVFTAHYARLNRSGDNGEDFVAEIGEITITESTHHQVAGAFEFTGFRICPAPENPSCTVPDHRPLGAELITVTGTFVSQPFDGDVEPLKPPVKPIGDSNSDS